MAHEAMPTPYELALPIALALFEMKIARVASRGINLVCEFRTQGQLEMLDNMEASFLKPVLSMHRSSTTRLSHQLSRAP